MAAFANARPLPTTQDERAAQPVAATLPRAALGAGPRTASVVDRVAAAMQRAVVASPLTDAAAAFVPVQREMPGAAPGDIRLELRRGQPCSETPLRSRSVASARPSRTSAAVRCMLEAARTCVDTPGAGSTVPEQSQRLAGAGRAIGFAESRRTLAGGGTNGAGYRCDAPPRCHWGAATLWAREGAEASVATPKIPEKNTSTAASTIRSGSAMCWL